MKSKVKSQKSKIVGILITIGVMFLPVTVLAVDVGAACTDDGECTTGSCASTGAGCFCSSSAGDTCALRLAIGADCLSDSNCQAGLRCGQTTLRCEVPANETPTVWCWCKKSDGTCENHRLNDAREGYKSALRCSGARNTSAEDTTLCSAYCGFRRMVAAHCDTTYLNYLERDPTPVDSPSYCKPSTASAETPAPGEGQGDGGESRTSPTDFGLNNPLGSTDLRLIISRLIRAVLGVVGALFLVMFVYGGVMWMTAGDSKRIDTAKKTFVNAVIGMAIVAFSYSMVSLVFNLAGQVSGGG